MLEFELKISLEEAERIELPNFWWDGTGHGVIEPVDKEWTEELLAALLDRKLEISWRPYETKDWVGEQQAALEPVQVGKFFLYGPHHQVSAPDGTIPICVDATHSFGSGHHPTTRTCLELLQELSSVESVLDMGCGSGILARAAAALFDAKVIGCDNQKEAVDAARQAGLEAILSETPPNGSYDLIMANIHSGVLVALAERLKQVSTDTIILSGILPEQTAEVVAAYAPLTLVKKRIVDGWVTLMLQWCHGSD